jgi:uncharacterized iron-regulated membrane protein
VPIAHRRPPEYTFRHKSQSCARASLVLKADLIANCLAFILRARRRTQRSALAGPDAFVAIDKIVATVAPVNLAPPVFISHRSRIGGVWTAKSDTRNRPLRVDLVLDPATGDILKRTDFYSKLWLDRVIGTGITAHEGQPFGLANQLIGLLTVISLVALSVSGIVMWSRRKPEALLGSPRAIHRVRFSTGLIATMCAFGLCFPFWTRR